MQDFCNKGFPEWAAINKDIPYKIWEPSHEIDVIKIRKLYESHECKRDFNHETLSGIRIVSNQEREMH